MQINEQDIIRKLEEELKKPLPGIDAQLKMVPGARKSDVLKAPKATRNGGVLILLYEHRHQFMLVFIERTKDGGVHSGQISFPGGKFENKDKDLIYTALREANEEIGVATENIKILGNLSEVNILASNFLVLPTVGYYNGKPDFKINPLEVESLIEIPLNHFVNEKNCGTGTVDVSGNKIEVPVFRAGQHQIWGATAMMLSEFIQILQNMNGKFSDLYSQLPSNQ